MTELRFVANSTVDMHGDWAFWNIIAWECAMHILRIYKMFTVHDRCSIILYHCTAMTLFSPIFRDQRSCLHLCSCFGSGCSPDNASMLAGQSFRPLRLWHEPEWRDNVAGLGVGIVQRRCAVRRAVRAGLHWCTRAGLWPLQRPRDTGGTDSLAQQRSRQAGERDTTPKAH